MFGFEAFDSSWNERVQIPVQGLTSRLRKADYCGFVLTAWQLSKLPQSRRDTQTVRRNEENYLHFIKELGEGHETVATFHFLL